MRLAAGPGDGLGLHGEHSQVVGQPASALDRVEAGGQFRVLGTDPGGVAAVLEVVVETGCAAELFVFGGIAG